MAELLAPPIAAPPAPAGGTPPDHRPGEPVWTPAPISRPPPPAPPPAPECERHAPVSDYARFRAGIELTGSVLKPPSGVYGGMGTSGQVGVQPSNLVGLYLIPGFTYLAGSGSGLDLTLGALIDFTFLRSHLSAGLGPEAGVFGVLGGSGSSASGSAVALGAGYGGRLHLAWNIVVDLAEDGVRRRGLVVAIDSQFIWGPVGTVAASATRASESTENAFIFAPVLSVGYVFF